MRERLMDSGEKQAKLQEVTEKGAVYGKGIVYSVYRNDK